MSEIQHYMDAVARLKAENSVLERERDEAQQALAARKGDAVWAHNRELLAVNAQITEHRDEQADRAAAAEARLAVATDALRDCLHEAGYGGSNHDAVRDRIVTIVRAVLVGGDAGLEDPAFDDSQGHGEGRLKPAGLREDAT